MLLKDHWYVACPASRLPADKPIAFQVGQDKYVAFRDAENRVRLLADRCCHRGVQLSKGRVVNGCLACGYHGWEYNGRGKLVHVPALGPDKPVPDYSVPGFHAREQDFYIWIWIAGESTEPTYEPGIGGLVPGLWIQQSRVWQTNVIPAVENQLDNAHTPFSHPGIYPGHASAAGYIPELKPMQLECFSTHKSVHLFWPPRTTLEDPVPRPEAPGSGFALFELPYRNYVFLTADGIRAIYHWVPLTDTRCRLEFMGYSNQAKQADDAETTVMYVEEELQLLQQDRQLLESAQYASDASGARHECSIHQDVAPMMARKLIRASLAGAGLKNFTQAQTRVVFECYF